jgi:hypothetical protein
MVWKSGVCSARERDETGNLGRALENIKTRERAGQKHTGITAKGRVGAIERGGSPNP